MGWRDGRKYNVGSIAKLRSGYIKCMKLFFGYSNYSVTSMLLKLGLFSFDTLIFTGRQHCWRLSIACYAEPCISYGRVVRPPVRPYVCLSVRPSVTRWHRVKTTQARTTKSSSGDTNDQRTMNETNCGTRKVTETRLMWTQHCYSIQ